jgi:hypothetical protein
MKNAHPIPKDKAGGPGTGTPILAPVLTPRQHRLLSALLVDPCTREDVDRITGASNGPDEVLQLRRQHRMTIPCTRKGSKDKDDHPVQTGIYRLTTADRLTAQQLLAQGRAA